MSTVPPPSSSGPERSRPLSDREWRILAEVGEDLLSSDPRLGAKLSRGKGTRPHVVSIDRVVRVVAVGGICFVVLPDSWLALLSFLVVLIGMPVLILLLIDCEQERRV